MKEVFIVPKWVGYAFLILMGGICTSAYFPALKIPRQGGGIRLTVVGDSVDISFSGRLSYYNTSAASLTLGDTTIYTFSGTNATWTLPPVVGWEGKFYVIKQKGTGTVTINSNTGGNDIFDDAAVNSITLLAGETYTIFNDAGHWCTKP